jgi:UDP-2-acetamido-3-amino-2,3-dideoxy-glucuronate N-acetyltransferase
MDSVFSPAVAVLGSGYWGMNLVRNFHELGALQVVCDTREEALCQVRARYGVRTTQDLDSVLNDNNIQGVVIAAPAVQHFTLAKKALLHGKDVYVEKPLALHAEDGRQLVQIARDCNRILMVGHILQYHPAILELHRIIRSGDLGRIQYIHSSRLNLGKLRTEENILWSFAPHDISAILFLLGETPTRVSAHGGNYVDFRNFDTTLTTCDFASGVKAHIFVSWLHPFKEQKLAIVGTKKMAVFDDVQPERKLMLYSHRIDWVDRIPVAHKADGECIQLPALEPLRQECAHFLECIRTRGTPRTSGQSAVPVLEVLEACECSLRAEGHPVPVNSAVPRYYVHPTSVIDEGAEIAEGTKIWHFSHVMAGAKLGANCNLGQNVVISPRVTVGNNVKIQNNVSVYTGVVLEDNVFCGPSMVFTNVINPRSHVTRKHEYRTTRVREGASIGANATVVCGVTLGRYSFVAAGAVVTRDVADYSLVVGVPAQHAGWMCYCGVRLPDLEGTVACPACERHYHIDGASCHEVVITPADETPVVAATELAA